MVLMGVLGAAALRPMMHNVKERSDPTAGDAALTWRHDASATRRPDVFAVGDVRSGSTWMVAPALGKAGWLSESSQNIWLGPRVRVGFGGA